MPYSTLLIDLDETLYPASSGVWDAISVRMEQYMHERLHLPLERIPALRRELYHAYGTTLRGLQETLHVDEKDYLDFVHDIQVHRLLRPDPELREVLLRYPQLRKIIFTNADRNHARRVLDSLGIADCFEQVVDIYDISPYCKPMPEAYQAALRKIRLESSESCIFIDDSPRNLAGAKGQGFYTIQVGHPKAGFTQPTVSADASILRMADLPSVLDLLFG